MQRHFPVEGVRFLCGHANWDGFTESELIFFDSEAIAFIESLSQRLLDQASLYPNLAALGFFLRQASVQKLRQRYSGHYTPRGLAFHLTPSNVAATSIYSWATSLLAGNASIVRFSNRIGNEQLWLNEIVAELLHSGRFNRVSDSVRFIQYPHSDALNSMFSAQADLRVLWGGNETIAQFAKYSLPEHAMELKFCDRRSLAVIDGNFWQQLPNKQARNLCELLAKDIFTFGQMACSSPSLIIFIGEGQEQFFEMFADSVDENRYLENNTVEKLIATQHMSMKQGGTLSSRQGLTLLHAELPIQHGVPLATNGNLYFVHKPTVGSLATSLGYFPQTCVIAGDKTFIVDVSKKIKADRYVKPGGALALNWVWDGVDIVACSAREQSRI